MEWMETLKVFIMAVFQGIGEFLPISSSGHLLVLGNLFFRDSGGIDEDQLMTLNILLHTGTLLSILIVLRRWIWEMLTENRRLILLIIAGSVPTAAVGLLIEKKMEFMTGSLWTAGMGFIVTGILLIKILGRPIVAESVTSEDEIKTASDHDEKSDPAARVSSEKSPAGKDVSQGASAEKTLKTMTCLDALFIGLFQGLAVLPGLSRSGFTIVAGVMRRIRREDAAVFSFLLAIPAIGGATLLEALDYFKSGTENAFIDSHFKLFMAGTMVSLLIGIVSLVYLMKWLKKGKLHYFAWWLFLIGPAVLIWQAIELWIK